MDWLKSIAPTVATALGGPLAGLAVQAIGSAFGWEDSTKEKVVEALQSGQLSGEQIAALKQVEADLIKHERELGVRFAELEIDDRKSAREREVNLKDPTNRVLAYLIVVVWGVMNWYLVTHQMPEGSEQVIARVLGTIDAALVICLHYFFGSTSGSYQKTKLLADTQK
ncbi:MAG: hypothetical protein IT531_03120 [Burkholderiales bacterium]|nr:hypothetical protein [Burkholderiales bacterium]